MVDFVGWAKAEGCGLILECGDGGRLEVGGGGEWVCRAGLGFGSGSLWFKWFKASHFEIRHHLIGNLSEDRLSQRCRGSLK